MNSAEEESTWPASFLEPVFQDFPKITRLFEQEVVVTEKIDGTNALVFISEDGSHIRAGSRTRWIYPGDDNYGFAFWVSQNQEELLKLGPGYHYGEWWGRGIQRNYGMNKKVFSLFNVHRWSDPTTRPTCCDVVPVIYTGPINRACFLTPPGKSPAAEKYGIDFFDVEGVMYYFTKAGVYMKNPFNK